MKALSNQAAAAKMIRAELKRNGIKASVTSESFSMGDAVRVHIYQDVLPAARDAIEAFVEQFQYGRFDGMQDLYESTNRRHDIPQSKYVSLSFHYSDALRAEARAFLEGLGFEGYAVDDLLHQVLNGSSDWGKKFWRQRKPRARVPVPLIEERPVAVATAEIMSWLDPNGALRDAGLLSEGGRIS